MKFLINGYFGYGNAGDEAVLAAMLAHMRVLSSDAAFTVTSGDPLQTQKLHPCLAVPRQSPRHLLPAIQACDVFISGGGSLVQDVTSVRNAVYYTTLIRLAKLSGKPVMVYAQGVGPLRKPISQKLARAAFSVAKVVTVRDEESAALLRKIGVRREFEVTADPVWALEDLEHKPSGNKKWLAALRSWPASDAGAVGRIVGSLRTAAKNAGASLRFLPMQPGPDDEMLRGLVAADEIVPTKDMHPRDVLKIVSEADLMLAMRLHALIFAASVGVPVVAFDYDPKVASLAKILSAPLVPSPSANDLETLPAKIAQAHLLNPNLLGELRRKARRNAELAVKIF